MIETVVLAIIAILVLIIIFLGLELKEKEKDMNIIINHANKQGCVVCDCRTTGSTKGADNG
jgi:hypothetical protein